MRPEPRGSAGQVNAPYVFFYSDPATVDYILRFREGMPTTFVWRALPCHTPYPLRPPNPPALLTPSALHPKP